MNKEELIEILAQEEALTADGFDDALVGCTCGANCVAVYDLDKMIDVLMSEGMSDDEALDFLHFNVVGAYVGDKTPQYMKFVNCE